MAEKSQNSDSLKFTCQLCEFSSRFKNALTRHQNTHDASSKALHCDQCSYNTTRTDLFKLHQRKHLNAKPFKCQHCDYRSTQLSNLKRHQQKIHKQQEAKSDTPKTYECDDCKCRFRSAAELKEHRNKENDFMHKPFSCTLCSFRTKRAHDLKSHIKRLHTDDRNHHCSVCGYGCHTAARLKEHIRTHTGEKVIKCEQCDFTCTSNAHLHGHKLKVHEGKKLSRERQTLCDICGKSFRRENFRHHRMTHTGTRPYKCDLCDFTAIRKFKLVNHRKTHHIDNEITDYGGMVSNFGLDLVQSLLNNE